MYVRARSDTTSGSRVENLEMERAAGIYEVAVISRSREVHQSWKSTIVSTIIATADSFILLLGKQPDLVNIILLRSVAILR